MLTTYSGHLAPCRNDRVGATVGALGGSASADSCQPGLLSGPPQSTLRVAAAGDTAGTTPGSQDVVEIPFHL